MKFEEDELERQVLSAMMLSPEDRLTAFQVLPTIDCFQVDKHRIIAQAVQAQQDAGEPVDLETTVATIKKSGLVKEAGGIKYIAQVFSSLKSPGHIEVHCRYLVEQYIRAKLYGIRMQLLQE
jgi:replicative DNA helicase